MQFVALVIGDWHITSSNIAQIDDFGSRLVEIASDVKPDRIFVMGDTLNDFSRSPSSCASAATVQLNRLSEVAPVVLLIGNHDIPCNSLFMSESHYFKALRWHPRVTLVDTMCWIEEINGINIACVPYSPEGRLMEALCTNEDFNIDSTDVVFCHQQFYDPNMPYITGENWDYDRCVINGHMHKKRWVQKKRVFCVGTPWQTDFGDTDTDKTVSKITFSRYNERGRVIGNITVDVEDILVGMPPKITYTIDCDDITEWEVPVKIVRGNIRIEARGTLSEISAVKSNPKVRSWVKRGVTMKYVTMKDEPVPIRKKGVRKTKMVSFEDMLLENLSVNERYVYLYNKNVRC